ncbi:hypothetical protein CCO03_14755 [Comamonas serinivorans]|uniref:Lipoprotein n=1 Tax=Comamonas serinivorans TaxID=1082851 RepID=A0A1Y0EQ39_9BURK|nr:hypothetical protein [Comamonas serinivorans]ARU05777.1 hypothetical protein CCO03_14755 [Comamonas serinivorans]
MPEAKPGSFAGLAGAAGCAARTACAGSARLWPFGRRGPAFWLAALGVAALAGCATAPSVPAGQVERLQDQFLAIMPLGEMLGHIAAHDPNWPLQNEMDRHTPQDVACMRRELAPEKGNAVMRQRAADYARKHPDRVSGDVAMLDDGAVRFVGGAMRAGMFGGAQPDPQDLKGTIEFLTASRYADLREALYLDGATDAMLKPGGGYRMGQQIGMRFMVPLTVDAARACGLDLMSARKPLKSS